MSLLPPTAEHRLDIEKHLDAHFPVREQEIHPEDADFAEAPVVSEEQMQRMLGAIRTDLFDALDARGVDEARALYDGPLPAMLERAFYEGYGIDRDAAYRLAEVSMREYFSNDRMEVGDMTLPILLYRLAGDRAQLLSCAELAAHSADIENLDLLEEHIPPAEFRRLARIATYVYLHNDIRDIGALSADDAFILVRMVRQCVRDLDLASLEILYDACRPYVDEDDEGMQQLREVLDETSPYFPALIQRWTPESDDGDDWSAAETDEEADDDAPWNVEAQPADLVPDDDDHMAVSPNRERDEDHVLLASDLAHDEEKSARYNDAYRTAGERFGFSGD